MDMILDFFFLLDRLLLILKREPNWSCADLCPPRHKTRWLLTFVVETIEWRRARTATGFICRTLKNNRELGRKGPFLWIWCTTWSSLIGRETTYDRLNSLVTVDTPCLFSDGTLPVVELGFDHYFGEILQLFFSLFWGGLVKRRWTSSSLCYWRCLVCSDCRSMS